MKLLIDIERCKGCGLCVAFCPKKVLEIGKKTNKKGYNYITEVNEDCIFCTSCCIICPDSVYEIVED